MFNVSSYEPEAKRWSFHGGLELPDNKTLTHAEPIQPALIPPVLVQPLQQHIGEAGDVLVAPGDTVAKGQVIARAHNYVSAPLHASSSGTVIAVEARPVPHPSGLAALCVVIETDGEDRWTEERLEPIPDYTLIDRADIRARVREAGIVGQGGAAFPAAVKLNPRPEQPIDTVVLNAAECEPYITCDDRLMQERPGQVIEGLRIIRHLLGNPERCLIGIEDNKPQAYRALRDYLAGLDETHIRIVQVPSRYPTGGEKQLIKVLTGREVPSQRLPADVGVVCHNVGTAAAIYRAVILGEPLIERIVTVTGHGVHQPCNLAVRMGTPLNALIERAGGYNEQAHRLILGGPMMGFAASADDIPLVKATNCLLVATQDEVNQPRPAMPCIRCGECVKVCPSNLLPQQLYWHARAKDLDRVQQFNLFDCIECGCCAYVCPANIPLVQYFRFAKTELWAQERDKAKADHARRRYELRQTRKQREEEVKAARLAQKKAAINKPAEQQQKSAEINDALARVKAKQAESSPAADKQTESEHA